MKVLANFVRHESLQESADVQRQQTGIEIAMYCPDQAGNVGAAARLAACLGIGLHIIEPCGFPLDDQRMRRAGMDYLELASLRRHQDWASFRAALANGPQGTPRRMVLLSTHAECRYDRFAFRRTDILLLGSESAGVPPEIHAQAEARVRIPIRPQARSLNLVVAAAMVAAHAAQATGLFDGIERERQVPEVDPGRGRTT
jgi:tRNA (cytidine/uridine-2'-O-)-methyltransferase